MSWKRRVSTSGDYSQMICLVRSGFGWPDGCLLVVVVLLEGAGRGNCGKGEDLGLGGAGDMLADGSPGEDGVSTGRVGSGNFHRGYE